MTRLVADVPINAVLKGASPLLICKSSSMRARTRQLNEAIEREQATAEVLRVISSSPGELKPVFEAMLANAVRLCEAKFGRLDLHEGGALRAVAVHNLPPAFTEARKRRGWYHPHPDSALGRVISSRQTVHALLRAYCAAPSH